MLLYDDLVDFYLLLDPASDHEREATSYRDAFARHIALGSAATLLDLGAGAANNAAVLARSFGPLTLVDRSTPMLGLAARALPAAERVVGDLRMVRLGRSFDAVLVHDAIMYMTTEDQLAQAIATAFVHTRPGGAAVFAPDVFRETFAEAVETHEGDEGERALRALSWTWDPDPSDTTFVTDYAFLLREGTAMRSAHDRHVEGLFPRATWTRLLERAGFEVGGFERPLDDGVSFDEMFICRRPT